MAFRCACFKSTWKRQYAAVGLTLQPSFHRSPPSNRAFASGRQKFVDHSPSLINAPSLFLLPFPKRVRTRLGNGWCDEQNNNADCSECCVHLKAVSVAKRSFGMSPMSLTIASAGLVASSGRRVRSVLLGPGRSPPTPLKPCSGTRHRSIYKTVE